MKWAIIGTGNISHQFASDSQIVDDVEIVAVASRNLEKATNFAKEFNIPNVYTDYNTMLSSEEIDNVYIGTPHTTHKDISIYFLNKGINVLCEKPLAVNKKETEEIINAAKANNTLLMEAMWTLFFPAVQKAKDLIDSRHFGKINSISASAGYGSNASHDKWRYQNSMAGGTLLDMGIYPIHFFLYLFGTMPTKYTGFADIRDGVDVTNKVLFDFDGTVSNYDISIMNNFPWEYNIYCEKGSMHLDKLTCPSHIVLKPYDGEEEILGFTYESKGMQYQIKAFDDASKNNLKELPPVTYEKTLDAVTIMDNLRNEWGLVYPSDK